MLRAVDKADAMHADAFQRSTISEAIYHFLHFVSQSTSAGIRGFGDYALRKSTFYLLTNLRCGRTTQTASLGDCRQPSVSKQVLTAAKYAV